MLVNESVGDGFPVGKGYTDAVVEIYDEGFGMGFDDGYSLGTEETKLLVALRLYIRCDLTAEQISDLVDLPVERIQAEIVKKR